jgi:hypothetical protein
LQPFERGRELRLRALRKETSRQGAQLHSQQLKQDRHQQEAAASQHIVMRFGDEMGDDGLRKTLAIVQAPQANGRRQHLWRRQQGTLKALDTKAVNLYISAHIEKA